MNEELPQSKPFWQSKTLWVNAIAIAAIIIQGVTGKALLSGETQATILGLINVVLRLVTRQPVAWS